MLKKVETSYSRAVEYFGTSATEIILDLKRLPINKIGNLNEWSTAKLVEEVMILLHRLRKKLPTNSNGANNVT